MAAWRDQRRRFPEADRAREGDDHRDRARVTPEACAELLRERLRRADVDLDVARAFPGCEGEGEDERARVEGEASATRREVSNTSERRSLG